MARSWQAGFTGITDVFERIWRLLPFSRSDRFRLAELTSGLGERFGPWAWRSNSIPASAATTPPRRHPHHRSTPPVQARGIAKIVVHGSQATVDHVGWPYRPQSLTSAQMNLPFSIATRCSPKARVRRPVLRRRRRRPRRMSLAARWEVVHDPAITARGAKLRHMVRVEVHSPTAPASRDRRGAARRRASSRAKRDVVDKFRKLTRRVRTDADAERIANWCSAAKLADIGVLAAAGGAGLGRRRRPHPALPEDGEGRGALIPPVFGEGRVRFFVGLALDSGFARERAPE
jgi:hypothetical protein